MHISKVVVPEERNPEIVCLKRTLEKFLKYLRVAFQHNRTINFFGTRNLFPLFRFNGLIDRVKWRYFAHKEIWLL
jgi:hypothetical protein